MRYITHLKYRNWSKCDVRRILNCDIYRIYFLNAMYVASACGVLENDKNHGQNKKQISTLTEIQQPAIQSRQQAKSSSTHMLPTTQTKK